MVDENLELEEDVGEATIVYEGAEEDPAEVTVPNEHVAYFQDHWMIKTDEDEEGRDMVRRIPGYRVYHVERSVEEFEEEIKTLRDRVQSLADDIRTRIPVGGSSDGRHGTKIDRTDPYDEGAGGAPESVNIDIDEDRDEESDVDRDETDD